MGNPFRLPMATTAIKNFFSRPATRIEPSPLPERARGRLAFDVESCVFCGLCARRCPSVAIEVVKAEKRVSIQHLSCVLCGVCVEACSRHSLTLEPKPFEVQLDGRARGRVSVVQPAPKPAEPDSAPQTLPKVG